VLTLVSEGRDGDWRRCGGAVRSWATISIRIGSSGG
jgi:hypothetical protein